MKPGRSLAQSWLEYWLRRSLWKNMSRKVRTDVNGIAKLVRLNFAAWVLHASLVGFTAGF
jgi:hypothetical protein